MPVFTVFMMVRRRSLMCGLPASHGENRGSSPLGSANNFNNLVMGLVRFVHFWGVFGE